MVNEKVDDKILRVLMAIDPGYGGIGEWEIASRIYPFGDTEKRAKRGAWIRVLVQALWRLECRGMVVHSWDYNGTNRYWAATRINYTDTSTLEKEAKNGNI